MQSTIECNFSNNGTRNGVRMRVVNKFSEETPGNGKGEFASKYLYSVEKLSDNYSVLLKRPANLKNGFDFLITVPGINFALDGGRVRDYPKHEDIINDLVLKKKENEDMYQLLFSFINLIFECNEIEESWFDDLSFESGYPCDLILKTIKWFFIEQDIRYWNYSGRYMLMSEIEKLNEL
ncbi:hypothetical protein [Methanolobus bombayensis]|uniref:hypothetical protein n=1 Tax=Methanolobus bombayensis TaxID=38023 RepID=UPI001AE9B121|nr:hypothetical protein [Methanolobus bombayensis]MBP1910730.1 hypothetical protein [Methanolobus bombayensis]